MIEEKEVIMIKEAVNELLEKMMVSVVGLEVTIATLPNEHDSLKEDRDFVQIAIAIQEPQVLIGQNGQTLFELQRLLRIILNKKLKKEFSVALDINDYKKKKVEYLKLMAFDVADKAVESGENKFLPPMPAYERRIIHSALAERGDVVTESQGEDFDRCVVIKPKTKS